MPASNYLWKPRSESDGRPFIGLQSASSGAYILTPDGQKIPLNPEVEDAQKNGYQMGYRSPIPTAQIPPGSQIVDGNGSVLFSVDNPNLRYEDGNNVPIPPGSEGGFGGFGAFGGGFNYPFIAAPNFTLADYNYVDPLQSASDAFKQNLDIYKQSFKQGQKFVNKAIDNEFNIIRDFYEKSQDFTDDSIIPKFRERLESDQRFNQDQIKLANEFDSQQLLTAVETGTPGGRQKVLDKINRGTRLAETGTLSDAALDAAFDLNLKSKGAERVRASGFGGSSAYGDDVSRKFTALERFGVQQYGENLESGALNQAFSTFTAAPQRTPISASDTANRFTAPIASAPSISPAQATLQQTGAISSLGTINPATLSSQQIQQEQFQTTAQQNVLNANAQGQFAADQLNAANAYKQQVDNYDRAVQEEFIQQAAANQQQAQEAAAQAQQQQNVSDYVAAGIGFLGTPQGQSIVGGITDFVGGLFDSSPDAGVASTTPSRSGGSSVTPASNAPGGSSVSIPSQTPIYDGGFSGAGAPGGDFGPPPAPDFAVPDSSTVGRTPSLAPELELGDDFFSVGSTPSYDSGGLSSSQGDGSYFKSLKNMSNFVGEGTSNYRLNDLYLDLTGDNKPRTSPLVAKEFRNVGVGTPSTTESMMIAAQSQGQPIARDAVELGIKSFASGTPSQQRIGNFVKSFLASPEKMLNVDSFGDPKVGIDIKDAGLTHKILQLDSLPESRINSIFGDINTFLDTQEKLNVPQQNANGADFINQLASSIGVGEGDAGYKSYTDTSKSLGIDVENPTAGDLDKARRTADYIRNNSKQFGVFTNDRRGLSDNRSYLEAGLHIYNAVTNWDKLPTSHKIAAVYSGLNSMIQSQRGGVESATGQSEEYQTWYRNNLETGLQVAREQGDTNTIKNIEQQLERLDNPDFIDKIFSATGRATIGAGFAGADVAARVSNWDRYNTLGKVGSGVQIAKDFDQIAHAYNGWTKGDASKGLVGAGGEKTLGVAGGALAVAGTIDNWSRMNDAQRFIATTGSISAGGNAASQVGLKAFQAGGKAAGFTSTLGQVAGVAGAVYSAYNIVDNWGQMDTKSGAMNGMALGASIGSVIPGVGTLIGAAAGAIFGAALGQISTGKNADQVARDNMRKGLAEVGFLTRGGTNDDFFLSLADGSMYDISQEGFEGELLKDKDGNVVRGLDVSDNETNSKKFYDPSKLGDNPFADEENRLRLHDVDYTNDLDFMTSISAAGLGNAMFGKTAKQDGFKNLSGYMTNAATSQNPDREFTQENFLKTMENMRSFYSQAGFDSEDQFNTHAKGLYDNGVIDQAGYHQMLQGSSMVFSDNFSLAQALNSTRWGDK